MKSIACTISVLALALLAGCQCQPTHNAYGFDLRPRYEREVKFVAHRGESTVAPENTVPAYELAWRNNAAWGVETDVYLTKDGVLICDHDGDTTRTAGVPGKIADKTLAELKALDVGSWKGPQWYGTRIPTLREVLATIPQDGHIFVEIKSAGEGFKEAFQAAFDGSGVRLDQISFISFNPDELTRIRQILPDNRTLLLLVIHDKDGKPSPSAEELIARLQQLDFTGADVFTENNLVDAEYIKKVHDAGFEIHFWTINDTPTAKLLVERGADSITTDRSKAMFAEWNQVDALKVDKK